MHDRYPVPSGARALLADLGVGLEEVLRRAELPLGSLSRTPATLTPAEYHAFWEALDEATPGIELPLAVAQALTVEVFDPPIFAAVCSPDLSVAAERIAAHKRLLGPLRLQVDTTRDRFRLEASWPAGIEPPAVLGVTELLFWVALVRIATRTRVEPLRVVAPVPPAHQDAYRIYLGVPITRGDRWAITFPSAAAHRPFLTADASMWEFFAPELRRRLDGLDAGASTADRVRAALLHRLPAGDPSMAGIGRELAISIRTLQRRLADEGTTFQGALNRTREDLARHYLAATSLPTAEIAFLLGYEDANSFARAFAGWTGTTPGRYRADPSATEPAAAG